MRLSSNMLNFLGFVAEGDRRFVDHSMAVGLAWPFGVASALKNGLIRRHRYVLEAFPGRDPLPGCPYGKVIEGYQLTPLGERMGAIGRRMRDSRHHFTTWSVGEQEQHALPFLKEGRALLRQEARTQAFA